MVASSKVKSGVVTVVVEEVVLPEELLEPLPEPLPELPESSTRLLIAADSLVSILRIVASAAGSSSAKVLSSRTFCASAITFTRF